MPRLKSPTTKEILCARCNQPGGTLKKVADGRYVHLYNCPKPPHPKAKITVPTAEEVVAVRQTKEE